MLSPAPSGRDVVAGALQSLRAARTNAVLTSGRTTFGERCVLPCDHQTAESRIASLPRTRGRLRLLRRQRDTGGNVLGTYAPVDRDCPPAPRPPRPHSATDPFSKGHRPAQSGVGRVETVRASSEVLSLADPDSGATLAGLETAGVVIYREFANEYRIWQGTDVDIRRLMELAHQRVKQQSLPEILSSLDQPLPVVAARHSAEPRCASGVHQTLCRRRRTY